MTPQMISGDQMESIIMILFSLLTHVCYLNMYYHALSNSVQGISRLSLIIMVSSAG